MDGLDKSTDPNTVFEFLVYLRHGCLSCFPHKRNAKHAVMSDRSPNEARRATREKMERLREEGYEVKEMWECEWKTMVQENEAVKRFVSGLERVDPLEPREAKPTLRVPLMVIIALTIQRSRVINVISPMVPKVKYANWQKVPKGNPPICKG